MTTLNGVHLSKICTRLPKTKLVL